MTPTPEVQRLRHALAEILRWSIAGRKIPYTALLAIRRLAREALGDRT